MMQAPRSLDGLPTPVRAAVGLAATVMDEVKHLPERAIGLPLLAMNRAMQASLHAQQRYAELTARGDQVLASRQVTDEPPEWATFDEPVDTPPPTKIQKPPRHGTPSAFDTVADDTVAEDTDGTGDADGVIDIDGDIDGVGSG